MPLTLSDDDIKEIDGMIKRTPFEYAFPIFTLFRTRIQEQLAKENTKTEVKREPLKSVPPSPVVKEAEVAPV